jgi:hypothetical protein
VAELRACNGGTRRFFLSISLREKGGARWVCIVVWREKSSRAEWEGKF